MVGGPRLRQVAVVAADYEATVRRFRESFGWAAPFRDPGVGQFGLINAVFAAGDTFIEVVTPVQPDTAAGPVQIAGVRFVATAQATTPVPAQARPPGGEPA